MDSILPTLRTIALIAVLGAAGAVARWLMSGWMYTLLGTRFAWGTLAVNVLGCFLLALLMYVGTQTTWFSPPIRTALAIGLLGGFTTYSTFGYETFAYLQAGNWRLAVANIAANTLLGLGGIWLGFVTGRAMIGGA